MKTNNLKIVVLICSLALFSGLQSQTLIPKKCYLHLTGSINKEFPMELDIVKNNDTIFGECIFYGNADIKGKIDNAGSVIPVSGKVSKEGNFVMTLSSSEKSIMLKGRFVTSQTLQGTCETAGALKNMPFELTEKYPEGSIPMNAYFQKGSVSLVKKPGSPSGRIQLSMLLPSETANPLVSDSLKNIIISRYTDTKVRISDPDKILTSIQQVYFDTYVNNNIDIYDRTSGQSFDWEFLNYMHIVQNNSHLLGFYTEQYAFTGGAHGLQMRKYTLVNLYTGKVILMPELFMGGYEEKLTEILTQKTKEQYSVQADRSLKDSGFFVDEIKPSDNFYVTRNGVGFYYNQYDIAPHSFGQIDLFIPFKEITGILIKEGVLKELTR
jgi:hypothetical protein